MKKLAARSKPKNGQSLRGAGLGAGGSKMSWLRSLIRVA